MLNFLSSVSACNHLPYLQQTVSYYIRNEGYRSIVDWLTGNNCCWTWLPLAAGESNEAWIRG